MKKLTTLLITLFIFWANFLSAQHLKKDGTPDMRFKENKSGYSTAILSTSSNSNPSFSSPTYNYSTIHLKKDGTPDKRYKENKTFTTQVYKPKFNVQKNN